MRWGVGKGRFRNLTAMFLCVLLAATFYAVWTFFNHVKPLTIDSSPQAMTATVSDRLINTGSYSGDSLRQSQLLLFSRIADSLDAVTRSQLRTFRNTKGKHDENSIRNLLADMQENVRRSLGMMLNETYTSAAEYRFIERKILATFNALDVNTEESATEREIIEHPAVEAAQNVISQTIDTTQVTAQDKELVMEFIPRLRSKLFAFATGLSSDDVQFHDYQATTESATQKTDAKKEKKGRANGR